ncbi:hypothetical protein DFH08DRAFT_809063 [Mycena albidolilacea]|uniref:Uncharacterized protein n=1 Tax=Mycena albidolilacea TaxID=1033008 RepID=A0AAD7ERC6_9AGAR|nr:hypothetical protein DFH08DRAFT_809063 [Mycena albidolilacea]
MPVAEARKARHSNRREIAETISGSKFKGSGSGPRDDNALRRGNGAALSSPSCAKFSDVSPESLAPDDSGWSDCHSCHRRKQRDWVRDREATALEQRKMYLAARSAEEAAAAIKRLKEEIKKSAIFLLLDLADLLKFGTNVIGHFFLTELLVVLARLINVSSSGYTSAPGNGIDFVNLKGGPERDTWVKQQGSFMGPWQSKIGNILVSNYFARTHADVLVSCALHPGGIKTDLQSGVVFDIIFVCSELEYNRHAAGWMQVVGNALLYPVPMGAYTQLWGATVAPPAQITGQVHAYIAISHGNPKLTVQYLVPWGKVGKADKRTKDTELESEVIAYIQDQIKGF